MLIKTGDAQILDVVKDDSNTEDERKKVLAKALEKAKDTIKKGSSETNKESNAV